MMKLLADYKDGERFLGQLLITSCLKGVTNNGLSYLTMELRDSSGQINGKKWEVTEEDEKVFVAGNVIYVNAEVIFYKTSLQLKVLSGKPLKEEEINIENFTQKAPVPYEELYSKYQYYRSQIHDTELNQVIDYIMKKHENQFLNYPAASSIHHNYTHGLLYHTVSMLSHGEYLANYYGDVDKELLYAATILHDVGKTVELEGPVVFKYSLEGKLIGHISIISGEIAEARSVLNLNSEKTLLLQHMILSHHGELEFGSPVMPLTKEAVILHAVDKIDSEINIVSKALDTVEEGSFTNKVFALDNRSFYKPKKGE